MEDKNRRHMSAGVFCWSYEILICINETELRLRNSLNLLKLLLNEASMYCITGIQNVTDHWWPAQTVLLECLQRMVHSPPGTHRGWCPLPTSPLAFHSLALELLLGQCTQVSHTPVKTNVCRYYNPQDQQSWSISRFRCWCLIHVNQQNCLKVWPC